MRRTPSDPEKGAFQEYFGNLPKYYSGNAVFQRLVPFILWGWVVIAPLSLNSQFLGRLGRRELLDHDGSSQQEGTIQAKMAPLVPTARSRREGWSTSVILVPLGSQTFISAKTPTVGLEPTTTRLRALRSTD